VECAGACGRDKSKGAVWVRSARNHVAPSEVSASYIADTFALSIDSGYGE
jgi:hypothetical protein